MPDKLSKLKRLLTLAEDPLGATFDEIEKLDERVTELETLPKLKGDKGEKGDKGDTGERGIPGLDGVDGKDGTDGKNGLDGLNGLNGKDGSPDTAKQVRDKLETLKGEERLDKSAIKGLKEELDKKTNGGVRVIGGRAGVQLYINGEKEGLVQTVNLIAGAGVVLTYSREFGRNDITISNDSVEGTVLEATGDVNSINTVFTFTSKPSVIVIDGTPYRETNKLGETIWSWNSGTLTATLTLPPQSDVYGLR